MKSRKMQGKSFRSMKKIVALRSEGLTFWAISKKLGHSQGWAQKIYEGNIKKYNKRVAEKPTITCGTLIPESERMVDGVVGGALKPLPKPTEFQAAVAEMRGMRDDLIRRASVIESAISIMESQEAQHG